MADLGRATRAYVSAYNRGRVVDVRLFPTESRQLVSDFNGAMEAGRTIESAVWDMDPAGCAGIASGAIAENQRSTSVLLTASRAGRTQVRCQVTLDNGEVLNQLFVVGVLTGPLWPGDAAPSGTTRITVTA